MDERARRAYHFLHFIFVAAPTIAGLDKFFHFLTDWNQYLAPQIHNIFPVGVSTFMMIVGVIEIAAGLLVAVKPRIGGWVVSAWLLGIVVNLLLLGAYYDVALRDLGLAVGAAALAELAAAYERRALIARVAPSEGAPERPTEPLAPRP